MPIDPNGYITNRNDAIAVRDYLDANYAGTFSPVMTRLKGMDQGRVYFFTVQAAGQTIQFDMEQNEPITSLQNRVATIVAELQAGGPI